MTSFARVGLAAVLLAAPLPALADPISGDAARAMLFPADRVETVSVNIDGLSDQDEQLLRTVAQGQKYYGAVAFSPSAGLMAGTTVMAVNHHTIEAARTAALAECESQRDGGDACVIAVEVRPAGWQARDLQLSADASEAFRSDYRVQGGGATFAISPSLGLWGSGSGADAGAAAIAECAGDGAASDCAVVIAD